MGWSISPSAHSLQSMPRWPFVWHSRLRRVIIDNVVVYNADPKYSSIISGVPGYPIEDVRLSNIRIYVQGGGTREQAALDPPEREAVYPEPTMFGELPAYGFFIRHVKGLTMRDVELRYL